MIIGLKNNPPRCLTAYVVPRGTGCETEAAPSGVTEPSDLPSGCWGAGDTLSEDTRNNEQTAKRLSGSCVHFSLDKVGQKGSAAKGQDLMLFT